MKQSRLSDHALLARIRHGDGSAFSTLVPRYHGSLVRVALGYAPSRAVAEEVAQETWVAVLDGLERFEGRAAFRTWLFKILVNRAKTRGVQEGRSVPFSAEQDQTDDEPAVDPSRFDASGRWIDPPRDWWSDSAEALLLGAEANATLQSAIASLPERCRLVVTLRDIEGLEAEEVCAVLGVSDANLRVLLHRARSRLRHALEERAGARVDAPEALSRPQPTV